MHALKGALCAALLCTSLSVSAAQTESAPIPETKKQLIDEFLEVTGALKIGQMMSQAFMQQMSNGLRQAKPDVDPRAFGIIEQEVNALIDEEIRVNKALNRMSYPIYNRYFSNAELEELIRFYKTPIGRKTTRIMPTVTQEAMNAGQRWGQSLAPKIQQRVEARLALEGISLN